MSVTVVLYFICSRETPEFAQKSRQSAVATTSPQRNNIEYEKASARSGVVKSTVPNVRGSHATPRKMALNFEPISFVVDRHF